MISSSRVRLPLAALLTAVVALALRVGTSWGLEIGAGVVGGLFLGYTGTRYNSPLFDAAVAGTVGAVLYGALWTGALAVTGGTPTQYVFVGTLVAVPVFAAEAIVAGALVRRRRD